MKALNFFVVFILCFTLCSFLNAQTLRQTGSIRGVVTDAEGEPLPGVRITVTGPKLIGSISDVTGATGVYRAPSLPPGTYTLVSQLKGFQGVRRENIVIETGSLVTINIQMALSPLEEEVTVTAASPVIDITTTKIATVVGEKTLRSIPFNRNLDFLMKMAPGVTGNPESYREGKAGAGTSYHGNIDTQNSYEVDGVNASDMGWQIRIMHVNYEAMEEVELVMGGLPAQIGNTGGDFINVVTKSGGNEFHGQLLGYYTDHKLTEVLYGKEQIKAFNAGQPTIPLNQREAEVFLGGPIIKDKLWFFADFEYQHYRNTVPFIPTTIQGVYYPNIYKDNEDWVRGMGKLTAQISPSLRFFIMGQWENYNRPIRSPSERNTVPQGNKDNWKILTTTNLSWILNPNTLLDIRAGLVDYHYLILNYPGTEENIGYTDSYTGYTWGGSSYNNFMHKPQVQTSLRLTHFKDNFLGGNHEFGAGAELYWGRYTWDSWVGNPLRQWYYWDGNPYYYRGSYGLVGPHPTFGDGRLRFLFCGKDRNTCIQDGNSQKYGVYIQDAWTIKNRLTLNLGVRFDYQTGSMPKTTKTPANSDLAIALGETYLVPLYGLNPYGTYTYPGWDNPITYKTLSPRTGITYDLFGNGKTALKATFAQYAEPLLVTDFTDTHPLQPRLDYLDWYWWDLNNNARPDPPLIDRYEMFGVSPIFMQESYYKDKLDPNLRNPKVNEVTASIQHELFPNFKLTLQYFYRNRIRKYGRVLYEPNSKRYWYSYEKAPDWWIPFTTTVPAIGQFPAQEVTMYFMSNNAPWRDMFNTFTNIPELNINYQSIELSFEKRMSRGWAFGGSFVYAKQKSTAGLQAANAATNVLNANVLVNAEGPDPSDRPIQIKLYGVFDLPWNILVSFYGQYLSGLPWQRTVTVYPPAKWAADNNARPYSYTVNVEPQGTRRYPSNTSVDLRIEKEFFRHFRLTLDVFNVLGDRMAMPNSNPSGRWRPESANTTKGAFTPDAYYGQVTSVSGVRYFKLGAAFKF